MIVDGRGVDERRGMIARVMERAAAITAVSVGHVSHQRHAPDDEGRRGHRGDDHGLGAIAMPADAIDTLLRIEAEGPGHERAAEIDGDVHEKRDEQQRSHAHAGRRERWSTPRPSAMRAPTTFTATVRASAISTTVIMPPR